MCWIGCKYYRRMVITPHDDEDAPDQHPGHHHSAGHAGGHDHNSEAAYLHVIADALTSLLAIGALLCAQYWGWLWADALTGIFGAILIGKWAVGLLKQSAVILLDMHDDEQLEETVQSAVNKIPDIEIHDLHVWPIDEQHRGVIVAVSTQENISPNDIRDNILQVPDVAHVTVEVHAQSQ